MSVRCSEVEEAAGEVVPAGRVAADDQDRVVAGDGAEDLVQLGLVQGGGEVLGGAGTAYTRAPEAVRILTASSSSRSRESVAWVTLTPCSASIEASSLCDRTSCWVTRSTICWCRAFLVAGRSADSVMAAP